MYHYSPSSTTAPLYPPSPVICPTLPVVPIPVTPNISPTVNTLQQFSHISEVTFPTDSKMGQKQQFQRPDSQPTSIKAEPGSIMGSIASASIANKASESLVYNVYSI